MRYFRVYLTQIGPGSNLAEVDMHALASAACTTSVIGPNRKSDSSLSSFFSIPTTPPYVRILAIQPEASLG